MDFAKYGVSADFISQYAYPELIPHEQNWRWCHRYAHDIVTEKIPSCKKMKWAALRHFRDLQRTDIYFDEIAAQHIVGWFQFCPIIKGHRAGQPMVLDPSQIFIAVSLMAWKWSEDVFQYNEEFNATQQVIWKGKRRYNQLYAQVSRKYGKTSFIAAIHLYLMKEYKFGPRIFSLATKKDQAKEVWNVSKKMIKLSPILQLFFTARANDILSNNEGEYKALASDSNSLDGLDPIAGSLDECHAIKNASLYGVMTSAFGSNEGGEFLFSVITTAGFILNGLCVDLYQNGSMVLNPDDETEQDNYFYVIFELDDPKQWEVEREWYKSNPALVYGRPSIQYLRGQHKAATMSLTEKVNFLTKHCNIFVSGSTKWLDYDLVKRCDIGTQALEARIAIYKEEKRQCYAAIDRARVNDINSITLLYADDDSGITLEHINIISQTALNNAEKYLKHVYEKAIDKGDLIVVTTATIRDEQIKSIIKYCFKEYHIKAFHYDPWHMREICESLADEGYEMIAVSQGTGNMSEPAKKLESLIDDKLVRYSNKMFDYACECALMGMTKKNNMDIYRDPAKWNTDKIDPIISTIIALSGATLIKSDTNVYDQRGLIKV